MKEIKYQNYVSLEETLPEKGSNIIGQYDENSILVYQAFNDKIASYAVEHQTFGGSYYNFNRMTWIKPNFLWMMYRAGWAMKDNQKRILAIRIKKEGFLEILKEAVHSSFKSEIYESQEIWKSKLNNSEVRLQWDPEHNPFGEKKNRKAIQLGLKGSILKRYCEDWILSIQDITDYVRSEKGKLDANGESDLNVPVEKIFHIEDENLKRELGITL